MKAERIEELLSTLGCLRINRRGTGVRSSCPLAPWTHLGARDKKPSFYVYIKDDDVSRCGCQACGFAGDLQQLLWKIQMKSGRDMSGLVKYVYENDTVDIARRIERLKNSNSFYADRKDESKSKSDNSKSELKSSSQTGWTGGKDYSDPLVIAASSPALDESHVAYEAKMTGWLEEESIAYLHGDKRRFTDETIKKWRLGWHPSARRISVPQYDYDGRLVNISGRHVPYWPECVPLYEWEKKAPKWLHSSGFHRELYLFGENNLKLSGDGRGTVFVTEGGFDVIYLDQCGIPNPVGINGSNINKIQMEKILRWFDRIVLIMDGDDPGIEAAEKLHAMFSRRTAVTVYSIPDGRDPNQLLESEIEELKSRFVY